MGLEEFHRNWRRPASQRVMPPPARSLTNLISSLSAGNISRPDFAFGGQENLCISQHDLILIAEYI
jgi:hypothetical protein